MERKMIFMKKIYKIILSKSFQVPKCNFKTQRQNPTVTKQIVKFTDTKVIIPIHKYKAFEPVWTCGWVILSSDKQQSVSSRPVTHTQQWESSTPKNCFRSVEMNLICCCFALLGLLSVVQGLRLGKYAQYTIQWILVNRDYHCDPKNLCRL